MENKNKKIIWLSIIILIIIGVIVLVWSLISPSKLGPTDTGSELTTENQPVFVVESPSLTAPRPIKPQENDEFTASNLARDFAARFGSWSTDNQGKNLQELLAVSSARMQNRLENIELNFAVNEFSGITTKALSTETIYLDEDSGDATIKVQTQRIATANDLSENIYYQSAEVDLIKSGNNWLVDDFVWQEL